MKELLRPNVGIACIIKNVLNLFNLRKIQILINKKVTHRHLFLSVGRSTTHFKEGNMTILINDHQVILA